MQKIYTAWPKGYPKSQHYPEKPVYTILEQTAQRVPNRIALIFAGTEITYAEFKELADRFASALAEMGVEKGDRVAIHLVNCPQFAIAYFGALKIGGVFSPLSPLLSPREVKYQLNDCGAETLVTLDLLYPGITSVIPETKVTRVITTSLADCFNALTAPLRPIGKTMVPDTIEMTDLLQKYGPHTGQTDIDARKDLAHLAYTGGTTGVSKGVMLTHANVEANAIQYANWPTGAVIEEKDGVWEVVYPENPDPSAAHMLRDEETSLVVVPWFHAMGTVGYLCTQILTGNTMIVLPRFDPGQYLDAIVRYKATMIGGAPQIYMPLINHPDFKKYDLSHVKMAGSGAAPLPRAVIDRLTGSLGVEYISEGYGLTECAMGATMTPPSAGGARPGSVGLPVFDTEIKIAGVATGRQVPLGETGEILIKGPQVMQGYYNKPDATAEVLKDGWLHTGDIGKMDEDGYVYITDRLKDMIIYKGYNVYPRELEELLFQNAAVDQCAVVGRPDADAGEAPVAFVKLVPGAGAGTGRDDLMEYVNTQVAAYKKIRDVIFVDEIPVSGAGKVLKRELKKTFADPG